jgi:hypothetical protein
MRGQRTTRIFPVSVRRSVKLCAAREAQDDVAIALSNPLMEGELLDSRGKVGE